MGHKTPSAKVALDFFNETLNNATVELWNCGQKRKKPILLGKNMKNMDNVEKHRITLVDIFTATRRKT